MGEIRIGNRFRKAFVLGIAAVLLFCFCTMAAETETDAGKPAKKQETVFSVCIDPGHQGPSVNMSDTEPMAPGSDQMKTKATTGTQGKYTGVPEYQLNLDISLRLEEELKTRGYRVVMTRRDNDTAISNRERALLASDENCDIMVRIHANGSDDPSVSGALAMVMSQNNPYVSDLFEDSYRLALNVLNAYCAGTGFQNLGVQPYDNMTGINWSQVPVMILEMGYMSNEADDWAMQNEETRAAMVTGIADGIDAYFHTGEDIEPETDGNEDLFAGTEAITEAIGENVPAETEIIKETDPLLTGIRTAFLDEREARGQRWAVSIKRLTGEDKSVLEYNGEERMQSASVIKVFIMAAILDKYRETGGEIDSLLEQMITVSDNEAANRLVELLGDGDFQAGSIAFVHFCADHGYFHTSIGRRFLESNPDGDNYTSACDCRQILSDIYNGTCVSKEASEKMLGLLSRQTLRNKIPSGLPDGYRSANKTGEMPEGYGLGCIENDIAIVFGPDGDYVLVVLSNDLGGDNGGAIQTIIGISALTASEIFHTADIEDASETADAANTADAAETAAAA